MHANPRAKINLTLSVGQRGEDGYHPISSVILRVGLSDELIVAFADQGPDTLTVGGLPGCPVDGNLVLRALGAVRQRLGYELPPLVAHLDKRIPMAAGLGGGSSDAAGAIEAAEVMWQVGLSPQVRAEIEVGLGADVPFFARGGDAALVTGRGESIERLAAPVHGLGVLLVTPPFGLSTAAVFARFDELGPLSRASDAATVALADQLRAGISGEQLADSAHALAGANDLWDAAVSLEPRLGVLRDALQRLLKRPWFMSGSGSTLFALYPSVELATADGQQLVAAESESLAGAMITAVDLFGPDPAWRFP